MIGLIEGIAKSRCLRSNLLKDFAAVAYFLRPTPSQTFVLGWSSNFVLTLNLVNSDGGTSVELIIMPLNTSYSK
jgi:hypothetical protein